VYTGWWTKWLRRVDEHIAPAFITRGLMLNPRARVRRFHQHPVHLVSGAGEQPVVLDLGRVDVSWLHKYGIPQPGQMAVVRSDEAMEPFRVVEIVAVRGLDEAARAEIARVEAEEAAFTAEHKQAEAAHAAGIAAAAAAAATAAVNAGGAPVAAAAPAAAGAAAIPQARRKRSARRETQELRFSLKSLEVTVVWWDLATEDFKNKMHFVVPSFPSALKKKNKEWWVRQCAEHETTFEELQNRLSDAGDPAVLPAAPGWLVDLELSCSFINCEHVQGKQLATRDQFDKQEAANQQALGGASFIIWGKLTDLFNKAQDYPCSRDRKSWKLKPSMHPAVRQDLTEQDPEPAAAAAAAAAAGAAAAGAAGAAVAVAAAAGCVHVADGAAEMEIDAHELTRPAARARHNPSSGSKRGQRVLHSDDSDCSSESDHSSYHDHSQDEEAEEEQEEDEAMRQREEDPEPPRPKRTSAHAPSAAAASSPSPSARRRTQTVPTGNSKAAAVQQPRKLRRRQ
jgi:hypothetical protein